MLWLIYFIIMGLLHIAYKFITVEDIMTQETEDFLLFFWVIFWPVGILLGVFVLTVLLVGKIFEYVWTSPVEYLVGKLHIFLKNRKK